MSWYREVYLRSEDWKNLRDAVLAIQSPDGRCYLCAKKRKLDVHHIQYRKLYDVKVKDLVAICRKCHKQVHELLKSNPQRLSEHPLEVWYRYIRPKLITEKGAKRLKNKKYLT